MIIIIILTVLIMHLSDEGQKGAVICQEAVATGPIGAATA